MSSPKLARLRARRRPCLPLTLRVAGHRAVHRRPVDDPAEALDRARVDAPHRPAAGPCSGTWCVEPPHSVSTYVSTRSEPGRRQRPRVVLPAADQDVAREARRGRPARLPAGPADVGLERQARVGVADLRAADEQRVAGGRALRAPTSRKLLAQRGARSRPAPVRWGPVGLKEPASSTALPLPDRRSPCRTRTCASSSPASRDRRTRMTSSNIRAAPWRCRSACASCDRNSERRASSPPPSPKISPMIALALNMSARVHGRVPPSGLQARVDALQVDVDVVQERLPARARGAQRAQAVALDHARRPAWSACTGAG